MTIDPASFDEVLRVGIIQTTLDHHAAWASGIAMTHVEEARAIVEIQQHLASLNLETPKPEVVLLPELSVPRGFVPRLRRISEQMNCILVAGVDFEPNHVAVPWSVRNRAAVIVPNRWRRGRSTSSTVRFVGKTHPSWEEAEFLGLHGYAFQPVPEIWLFDAGSAGRFGVAVCFDLLDLERVATYRMNLQHLFIVAYNKDGTTFEHAAEALSRMIFCNVVICNTGYYGSSLAVSPYKAPERRTIYSHFGANLPTNQSFDLPVRRLVWAQNDSWPVGLPREFKALPPGAKGSPILTTYHQSI